MNKAFLVIAATLTFSVAQASCIGEAQIIGKIERVKKSLTECRAFLTADTKIQTSMVCPLDEGKLAMEGFLVGIVNGHDCALNAGSDVSGILVDNGYNIYLE